MMYLCIAIRNKGCTKNLKKINLISMKSSNFRGTPTSKKYIAPVATPKFHKPEMFFLAVGIGEKGANYHQFQHETHCLTVTQFRAAVSDAANWKYILFVSYIATGKEVRESLWSSI